MGSNDLKSREQGDSTQQEVSRPSVISSNLSIKGNLTTLGAVHIDGTILGDIQAHNIVIGEKGYIRGNIVTNIIEVHGFITGDITGRIVDLKATAHVIGNTTHEAITIEKGACLDGNFQTTDPDR